MKYSLIDCTMQYFLVLCYLIANLGQAFCNPCSSCDIDTLAVV